ncbi:MAG: 30S ribosomal protein S6 [Alphaproteobacteria bacterium]|nr:30S ribosomal protein S6 [Alphaproteobacteria bacterium]
MAFYELVLVLRPELSDTQSTELIEKYNSIIVGDKSSKEFRIVKQEAWGNRVLAYPIRKNKKAVFFLLQISINQTVIPELERRMNLDPDVLRSMLVKVEEFDQKPSLILKENHKPRYKKN